MTSAKYDPWRGLLLNFIDMAIDTDNPRLIAKALMVRFYGSRLPSIIRKTELIEAEIKELEEDEVGAAHWWSLLRRIIDGEFGFKLGPLEERIIASFTKVSNGYRIMR